MIATIAMATRLTQPECAIEARHVSQLFGCAIQARRSRDDKKAFCVNSSTNKTLVLLEVVHASVRKIVYRKIVKIKIRKTLLVTGHYDFRR